MTISPEVTLARTISDALLAYAEDKARQGAEVASQPKPIVEDAALPTPRGPRQRDVAELLVSAPPEGWKTGEIAHTAGMDQPNAYMTLQALQKQGIAELVPGSDPQRWRLLPRYRQRQSILRAAALVREGEFTTYGDISQVVYGHSHGGKAIGRMAMTAPDFPHPWRVLGKGGLIPANWSFPDPTHGPEDGEQLLDGEGIEILSDEAGRHYGHPRHYIDGEELAARMRDESAT